MHRFPRRLLLLLAGIMLLPGLIGRPSAVLGEDDDDPVLRVEQDWEVVINTPDPANGSPELSFVISPVSGVSNMHGILTMNFTMQTGFHKGGFETQIWNGNTKLSDRASATTNELATQGEMITFTQVLQCQSPNSVLIFDVQNLTSSTWGNLTSNFINLQRTNTGYYHLNGHSVNTTLNESGVQSGGTRVAYMMLKEVRRIHESGDVTVIPVNTCVHDGLAGTLQTTKKVDSTGAIVPR